MRLTAELIQSSLSYLNPLKERELDLRGAFLLERA
jgi:U2 small nuclear ribonucleoprotein A'